MNLALDVSNDNPASEQEVRESGCVLLIAKATEGSTFADATYQQHRDIARKLGVRFGSYLFLHATGKASEARFYLQTAEPRVGDLVIIDVENGGLDGQPVSVIARRAATCSKMLQAGGHDPVLYCSSSFWAELVRVSPSLKGLRVWEAQYPGRFTRWFPWVARLRARLGRGATVILWQWSDTYQVGTRRFDASRLLVPVHKL